MSKLLNPIDFPEPKSEHSQVRGLVLEQRITRLPSDEYRVVRVQRQNKNYLIRLIKQRLGGGRKEHSFALSSEEWSNAIAPTIPIRYFLERTPLIMDHEAWAIEGLAARINYLIALHEARSKQEGEN